MILSETGERFIKIRKPLGETRCLQALGDNNRFEGKYVEAKELLTQARDKFPNIGFPFGVEQCESNLSEVVTESSRRTE